MEDIIKVDDQLIADKLAEPEWPWIIALAYIAEARAQNAVAIVIWWLDYYKDAGLIDIATGMALKHLNKALVGDASESDWSVIKEIERPIIQAIRAGEIVSFGSKKPKPDVELKRLKRLLWAGGEIIMNETSDLKPAGERESDSPTFARHNSIRAYDVHVSASDIRKLVDVLPPPQTHRHAEAWTKRALTGQQITAMEFLHICGGRWRNGKEGNAKDLLGRYEIWIAEKPARGEPLGKTAFFKWRDRCQQGYSVNGRKLIFPS